MPEQYKDVVDEIVNLNWQALDEERLQRLMFLSHAAAREFAKALRVTLGQFPEDQELQLMAKGELQTDNLQFSDYNRRGDHAEFLAYFLDKGGFVADNELHGAAERYQERCRKMDDRTRAMTIFSRERELHHIFAEILKNEHWAGEMLEAFRYFLQTHIALDSDEGGHAEMIAAYPIDDAVLPFWKARRDVYQVIPELFENTNK